MTVPTAIPDAVTAAALERVRIADVRQRVEDGLPGRDKTNGRHVKSWEQFFASEALRKAAY